MPQTPNLYSIFSKELLLLQEEEVFQPLQEEKKNRTQFTKWVLAQVGKSFLLAFSFVALGFMVRGPFTPIMWFIGAPMSWVIFYVVLLPTPYSDGWMGAYQKHLDRRKKKSESQKDSRPPTYRQLKKTANLRQQQLAHYDRLHTDSDYRESFLNLMNEDKSTKEVK